MQGDTMKFTQGHFEATALAIQEAKRTAQSLERPYGPPVTDAERSAYLDGIAMLTGELSRMFKASNGRFDAARFARACELGANVKNRVN